jgi:hypothetical protein
MREIIHQTLMWSAVAFGLIAAGLWYRASTVVVNTHDPRKAEVTIGGVATQATAEKQAQANKFAAIATAIAVALQALALLASK